MQNWGAWWLLSRLGCIAPGEHLFVVNITIRVVNFDPLISEDAKGIVLGNNLLSAVQLETMKVVALVQLADLHRRF